MEIRAGRRIDLVVVGEHVLTRIVVTVFQTRNQPRDFRDLVTKRLGDLPYRLAGAGSASPVLVLEEFATCRRLEGRIPIVNYVLRRPLPGRTMTIDYRTFLRRVKVFGLQGQVGYERRLPGKDRIDGPQVGIRMRLGKGG